MCTFYTNLQKATNLATSSRPPVPMKITCKNLNRPKQRSKWPQIEKRTPKLDSTCSWVALVESLLWVCCLFHLWGYQASTQGGWSWSSCPRATLCALLYFLREHQALISWQNSKDMASSSQESHTHTHTHTRRSSLSLSLSHTHTQRWRPKLFLLLH